MPSGRSICSSQAWSTLLSGAFERANHILRQLNHQGKRSAMAEGDQQQQVVLIGVDESKESFYSLEWALEHLLSPKVAGNTKFKIVLIHAKVSPASAVKLSGPGVGDVLSAVEKDIKRTAHFVIEKAKELCNSKSLTEFEVDTLEGDPRSVLCDAVDKHHADMLVVGSHGYGAFKRAILGSVSDYCAHHAHCSVLIVKRPKETKHPN